MISIFVQNKLVSMTHYNNLIGWPVRVICSKTVLKILISWSLACEVESEIAAKSSLYSKPSVRLVNDKQEHETENLRSSFTMTLQLHGISMNIFPFPTNVCLAISSYRSAMNLFLDFASRLLFYKTD